MDQQCPCVHAEICRLEFEYALENLDYASDFLHVDTPSTFLLTLRCSCLGPAIQIGTQSIP